MKNNINFINRMLIVESLFIGFYSCFIYFIVCINSFPLTLFIVGFLKHFLAYFMQNGMAIYFFLLSVTEYGIRFIISNF